MGGGSIFARFTARFGKVWAAGWLQTWFWPTPRRELFDLGDLGCGQAREQIFQVIERIDSVPPTTAQQRLNHCAAFPGFRMAYHRPGGGGAIPADKN